MRIRRGVTFAFVTSLVGMALGCGAPVPAAPTEVPQQSTLSPVAQTSQPPEAKDSSTANIGYEVGDHIPDFEMTLTDGEQVTSDGLLNKGEPVFLFFMATW